MLLFYFDFSIDRKMETLLRLVVVTASISSFDANMDDRAILNGNKTISEWFQGVYARAFRKPVDQIRLSLLDEVSCVLMENHPL